MKILIVDDMEENLYLLESLLKGSGYEVASAMNGAEALERLNKDSFDMIISDILMPKMDGYQLCREVKKDDNLRKIPFIFYTATYTGKKDEDFGLSLGADRFIVKPMEPINFIEIVEGLFKEHEQGKVTPSEIPEEIDDEVFLSQHRERLINKLEDKLHALEVTNKALRESEAKYSALVENATDGIVIVQDGIVKFVNTTMFDFLGYESEEIIGADFLKIVASENRKIFEKRYADISASKKIPNIYEIFLLRKDGTTTPVEINTAYIDYDGKSAEFLFIRDISERIQAEKKLQEASAIINKSPSVAFSWKNSEGWPVEFVSDNVIDLFGYTSNEFLSGYVSYTKIIHQDDRERVEHEVESISKEKDREEFIHEPYRIVTKNGTIKWVKDWTFIVRDEERNITHYNGIVEDISKQKQAEEAILESEKKYRDVVENASDIIFTTDIYGNYLFANKASMRISGYTPDELYKLHFSEFIDLKHKKRVQIHYMRQYRSRELKSYIEYPFKSRNGDTIWLAQNVSLIFEGDRITGFHNIARDITERKQAEQALADESIRRRILIEQSSDGIVILDKNGGVFEANRRFAEMLGYSSEEILTLSVWDWEFLFPKEEVLEMLRTVDEAGDHFETRHKRKDGTIFDVEISSNGALFA